MARKPGTKNKSADELFREAKHLEEKAKLKKKNEDLKKKLKGQKK